MSLRAPTFGFVVRRREKIRKNTSPSTMADITDSVAIVSEGTFEEQVQGMHTYLRTLQTHYSTDS